MNKFQLQRLFENNLVQFAVKVFIVSVGVIFTAFMIDVFDIRWMRLLVGDVYNNVITYD